MGRGWGGAERLIVVHVEERALLFLLLILDGVELVDTRTVVGGISSEGDIQGLKEGIHSCQQGLGGVGNTVHGWLTIIHNHSVGKISLGVKQKTHTQKNAFLLFGVKPV